jgi:dienelactone hydrolase
VNITALDWPYRDEGTALTGVLCRDEALPGPRPGILLVHGGAGLDGHARGQARRYAALGYAVLACDMLGDGVAGDRDRVIGCLTGGAVHGFTHADATPGAVPGVAYHPLADSRSFAATRDFLADVFARA